MNFTCPPGKKLGSKKIGSIQCGQLIKAWRPRLLALSFFIVEKMSLPNVSIALTLSSRTTLENDMRWGKRFFLTLPKSSMFVYYLFTFFS